MAIWGIWPSKFLDIPISLRDDVRIIFRKKMTCTRRKDEVPCCQLQSDKNRHPRITLW